MTPLLTTLRCCPQPAPQRFLRHQPGSWVLMRPDDAAEQRYRPWLGRRLDPAQQERLQADGWGVHFTAQPYGTSMTPPDLLCLRTLLVEVVLCHNEGLTRGALDRRKEHSLRHLAAFPLAPHWLIETRVGFQALFRIRPLRQARAVREAWHLQRDLNDALVGSAPPDELQLVRLPGSLHFGPSGPPFVCRLLEDHSSSIQPYPVAEVARALDLWRSEGRRESHISSPPHP